MSGAYSHQQSKDLLYIHILQDTEHGKYMGTFILYVAF
jgi:hypothetical protein